MKLRNKKTGEIVSFQYNLTYDDGARLHAPFKFAELNEEWEDYEEPKDYWCIDWTGGVNHIIPLDDSDDEYENNKKEIGNYFETKEEAEKAVEKLKAWKRLKSCGFKFRCWRTADLGADKYYFVVTAESDGAGKGDLDLIFGGEDE